MSFPSPVRFLSRRAALLASSARLVDAVLDSAIGVLMPLLRDQFGLSYAGVSALRSLHSYAEAITEPAAGMLLDVWPRQWMLGGAAIAVGLGSIIIGVAPSTTVLGLGFALIGGASGPVRQAGDVISVEAQRVSGTRVVARITMLATLGALAGPLLVSAWLATGQHWNSLQAMLGSAMAGYGIAVIRTSFPAPAAVHAETVSFFRAMRQNLRTVFKDRSTVTWLVFMRVFYVMDTPAALETVWLADRGMSTSLIGVYVAFEMAVAMCGAFILVRWLHRVPPWLLMLGACFVMLVLFPAWFLVPGTMGLFLVGAPLALAWSLVWPVARAESLRATDRPGAVSAVNSLTGLYLPVTLALGLLADRIGLTEAMLTVRMVGTFVLALLAWTWLPRVSDRP